MKLLKMTLSNKRFTIKSHTTGLKALTFLAIIILFQGVAFANQKQNVAPGYRITGTLKGINSGKLYLRQDVLSNRTYKTIDSANIKNGKFQLNGNVDVPSMMTIAIEPGNWMFTVFVEITAISIKADTAGAQHFDGGYVMGKGAIIKNVIEKGSKNYEDIKAFENAPEQMQLMKEIMKLNAESQKVYGKESESEAKIRAKIDALAKRYQEWQKAAIDSYLKKDSSSVAGVYLYYKYNQIAPQPYEALNAMLNKFTGEAKSSMYFADLDNARTKLAAIQMGAVAPDFTLLKRDSTSFTLSSLRGKYVMIDFWASWCVPCRKAIPHWKSVYARYHDKGFEILGVSNDAEWKRWTTAMDQEQMPWQQVVDEFNIKNMPARVISTYMTASIPFYVLLDKDGKILVTGNDESKIDRQLEEIFGN